MYRQFIQRADEAIEIKRQFNERKATREELEEAKKRFNEVKKKFNEKEATIKELEEAKKRFNEVEKKFNERKATRKELEEAKERFYAAVKALMEHRARHGLNTGHESDKMLVQAIYNRFFASKYPEYTENFDDDYEEPDISDEEWEDTYRTEAERKKAQKKANEHKNRRRSRALNPPGTNRTNLHYLKF